MIELGFKILTYQAFSPTDISGIKAWYDASTLTGADGSSVSQWLDQSGNEAHMFQGTSAARPTLQTNELNGRNVVRFDGVDDFLNMTAPFDQNATNTSSFHNCRFSNSGEYFVHINGTTSPLIFIYKKDGNKFIKIANPLTMPTGTTYEAAWTSDDNYLAIAHASSPRITIYKVDKTTNPWTFTKLSNPSVIPSGTAYGCDFSNDTNYLAVACNTTGTERLIVYKRSGDTFTDLAVSAGITTGVGFTCKFSPNSNFLAVGINLTTNNLFIYSRTGDAFTSITAPTTMPSNEVYSISWLSETVFAVCGLSTSILIYEWDGTKFELQQSISLGTANGYDVAYSRGKGYLAIGISIAPRILIYKITGNTYTLLPSVSSTPYSTTRGVSWGANDEYLGLSSGGIIILNMYKRSGDTFTNMNRLNMLRNVGGATVFAVVKYPANGIQNETFFVANNAGNTRFLLYQRSVSNFFAVGGRRLDSDATQNALSTTTTDSTKFFIHTGELDFLNSDAYQYLNGTIDGTNTSFQTNGNSSDTDSTYIRISGSSGSLLNGDIAEIIVYNRSLTNTEISYVHKYLSVKWGITIA